jgi:hypothetical protein
MTRQRPFRVNERKRGNRLSSLYDDPIAVSTYVILREGCALAFAVLGSGQAEVTCGEPRDGCQLLFDAESLRRFVRSGAAALRDMDARFASESTAQSTTKDRAVGCA